MINPFVFTREVRPTEESGEAAAWLETAAVQCETTGGIVATRFGITIALCHHGLLGEECLGPSAAAPRTTTLRTLEEQVNEAERQIIAESLDRNNHRRSDTARELGVSRVTLYNKMKKFGML